MEEEKSLFPPFLLSFEIFNFNVHNKMVYFGAPVNVMPLSITKKINVQWSKTSAQIFQLDKTCVLEIGELKDVIILLTYDEQVHQ